jgi:hypothetical protein
MATKQTAATAAAKVQLGVRADAGAPLLATEGRSSTAGRQQEKPAAAMAALNSSFRRAAAVV